MSTGDKQQMQAAPPLRPARASCVDCLQTPKTTKSMTFVECTSMRCNMLVSAFRRASQHASPHHAPAFQHVLTNLQLLAGVRARARGPERGQAVLQLAEAESHVHAMPDRAVCLLDGRSRAGRIYVSVLPEQRERGWRSPPYWSGLYSCRNRAKATSWE